MKAVKKPIEIDFVRFLGNDKECIEFCPIATDPEEKVPSLVIPTLEGDIKVSFGDYIIKGVNGEFYPCKSDIFHKTYTILS